MKEKRLKQILLDNVILIIVALIFIIITIIFQFTKYYTISLVLILITQFIICTFFLLIIIPISTDIIFTHKERIGLGFTINLIFIISAILFTPKVLLYGNIGLIICSFLYCIMIVTIYKLTKINDKCDFSTLNITNSIIAAFLLIIIFILRYILLSDNSLYINEKGIQFINYYYLVPNILVQGLYGFLELKGKIKNSKNR